MATVIMEVLPLALVVTLSPLNIIPSILLLFSRRPLRTATLFLIGFLLGVGLVLVAMVVLAGAIEVGPASGHTTTVAIVKVLLGAALLVASVAKLRARPKGGAEGRLPGWMDGLTGFSPARSFLTGVGLGAGNPKNIVVGVAAALAISADGLSSVQASVAVASYVVLAGLGVALPIVVVLVLGDRAGGVLERWKAWLRRNNPTVMGVLFAVFGVVLIGQGIAGA